MSFTRRTTPPSTSSKYWKHITAGGVNECIEISGGSCLPNCVGYAWGRIYEINGKKPSLSKRNAELWYGTIDGYNRGSKPRLGAVLCWSKGKVGNGSDGAGHVAVVERIYSDGSVLVSASGYNSKKRFYTQKIPKNGKLSGYDFQGYIYPVALEDMYTVGATYTTIKNLNVRKGGGLNYAKKKKSELTADGQKHAKSNGVLKSGTEVTVKQVYTDSDGRIWVMIPSGWICAYENECYIG